MNLIKPYEKSYYLKGILQGLLFYNELLDKVAFEVYSDENFPLKKKDILLTINFLEGIKREELIYRMSHSQPLLTSAMEEIESFSKMDLSDLKRHKTTIIVYLEQLLFVGTNLMYNKMKFSLPEVIEDMPLNAKLKFLIENKFYYTQNDDAFPTTFINKAVVFCESLIEKYKEIKRSEENSEVTDEIKRMVEGYILLIKHNIKGNDLTSPLIENNYEEFVTKIKALLYIPSFFDISKTDKEKSFHIYLLGILQGRMNGYQFNSNKEAGTGRYDICLEPIDKMDPGVIIEIKKMGSITGIDLELKGAIKQIESKSYNADLKRNGVTKILSIAIVFNGLDPNIEWTIQK